MYSMKRFILIAVAALLMATIVVTAILRSFRPRKEVAGLVENVLDLGLVAGQNDFGGREGSRLEDSLEQLCKDPSNAADEASVILLDYYLGEHNAELQECAVTIRGTRILPMLERFQRSASKPWKLRYLLMRLPRRSREFLHKDAIDAIRQGKILCD
jgi:hypothetical protein